MQTPKPRINLLAGGSAGMGTPIKLGREPDYYKVGEGFKNRYGTCKVFGSELASPYDCFDWLFKEEPYIWRDKTNGTFDCSSINNKISWTCCELVGAMVKWHNLHSGLSVTFTVQKKKNNSWRSTFNWSYNVPDPGEYGYPYWSWYVVVFWAGTWKNNGYWEYVGNGDYRIKVAEAKGRFSTKYIYFKIKNLMQFRIKIRAKATVGEEGTYYIGNRIVDATSMEWNKFTWKPGEHSIEITKEMAPSAGKVELVLADINKNTLAKAEGTYDFEEI